MAALRFGVNTLDLLVSGNSKKLGIDLDPVKSVAPTTSVCLIGPDGAGKSVLALHLAAHYWADTFLAPTDDPHEYKMDPGTGPRILYVSTDLTFDKAEAVWTNFRLADPLGRPLPFESPRLVTAPLASLEQLKSGECSAIADYLTGQGDQRNMPAFVDLARYTAGDDWGFVNRLVASLPSREMKDQPRHLVIIDAVEGLITNSGQRDAFGEERSRRGRIAQLMRIAAAKAHIVLVVEEELEDARTPEDYVTDVVIRVRTPNASQRGHIYRRRTIEIEKARAQTHARGQHQFAIRKGSGSTTSRYYNPDEPPNCWIEEEEVEGDLWGIEREASYINLFPSVHFLNRKIMTDVLEDPPRVAGEALPIIDKRFEFAGFGITHLDNMLAHYESPTNRASLTERSEPHRRGLPLRSTTVLIGETGTHKTRLGNAFLAQSFATKDRRQVSVLLTTDAVEKDRLTDLLDEHLKTELTPEEKERIICRRLEVHDISAAAMMHMVIELIWEARRLLDKSVDWRKATQPELYQQGGDIRFVIKDLSVMGSTYPDVEEDPAFLPALLFHLNREGITSLLIHTEDGVPNETSPSPIARVLNHSVPHHLYTWHVPFYGEDRIAITAQPPIHDGCPSVVRELRVAVSDDGTLNPEALDVDPHFEMYTGLGAKLEEPPMVPLEVRLWGAERAFDNYQKAMNALLNEALPSAPKDADIVLATAKDQYEELLSFSNLQGDTRRDKTTVLQVDEFWGQRHSESGLLPLDDYLEADLTEEAGGRRRPILANDPYQLWQPTASDNDTASNCRKNHLSVPYKYDDLDPALRIDRVPYTWDFGFLLLDARLWKMAHGGIVGIPGRNKGVDFRSVDVTSVLEKLQKGKYVSWRVFLRAAGLVAQTTGPAADGYPLVFDIDVLAPETFSCLVLEVWASEIKDSAKKFHPGEVPFSADRREVYGMSLCELMDKYRIELYRAWLLLGEVLSPTQFACDGFSIGAHPAGMNAVAARHWYSSAIPAQEGFKGSDEGLIPVRMPGHFSTRGDWSLGIARNSRSRLLGERAIDLLTTRRANVQRLQEGIGLPTRKFISDDREGGVWTRLRSGKRGAFGRYEYLKLSEIEALGAKAVAPINWLWRYTIPGYDRQSRLFLKFHGRILYEWRAWHANWEFKVAGAVHKSRGGWELYDRLTGAEDKLSGKKALAFRQAIYESIDGFRLFSAECGNWSEGLAASMRAPRESAAPPA